MSKFTWEEKQKMYREGKYVFRPPPVMCQWWNEDDWIKYIGDDGWRPEPEKEEKP